MKAIIQKDNFGCAIACVAFILKLEYEDAIKLFKEGGKRAKTEGFCCREIATILSESGLKAYYFYLRPKFKNRIYQPNTIVYIKKSKKYTSGHYLARYKNSWMDPWINFPNEKRSSGFRKRLPGKAVYAILQIKNPFQRFRGFLRS